MLSHRRFSRPVLSTTQPSLRVKKQFSRQTRVLYYHAGGTLSTKRPARNLKKTKNRACKPAKTVVFLVGCLRKLHIRVWRSLVSRLNGVQEASSSNLDTRTKGSAFSDESASFFIPDLAFLLFFDIISLKDKSEFVRITMDYKRIDASQIEALWKLQRLYKEEIKEDEPDLAGKERMTEAIKANSILFFGAYDEKALIGCCSVTVGFSTFNYLPSGVFEDFYILPEYRHKGIAHQLVQFARLESGVSSLTVGCADCDVQMYKALGFSIPIGNLLAFD